MNIIEAIKSGKTFRRPNNDWWAAHDETQRYTNYSLETSWLLATDWEVLVCEKHNVIWRDATYAMPECLIGSCRKPCGTEEKSMFNETYEEALADGVFDRILEEEPKRLGYSYKRGKGGELLQKIKHSDDGFPYPEHSESLSEGHKDLAEAARIELEQFPHLAECQCEKCEEDLEECLECALSVPHEKCYKGPKDVGVTPPDQCIHDFKEYKGLVEQYEYCKKCGEKKC